MKNMRIDRNEFIEEMLLRENIKKAISLVEKKRRVLNKPSLNEINLRNLVRKLLTEAGPDEGPTPHSSTGINVLEDLLKKIVPVLEDDYKQLTSSPEQRNSYRSHIVNAIQNSLAPSKVMTGDANIEQDLNEVVEFEVEDDIEGEELDDGQFIDISGKEGTQDEFGIKGQDQTGRNFAEKTFQKVETQILDAYALLSADEDREVFYDYLITNVKLYFDKFEDELVAVLPEPTNSEYEAEKDEQESADEEGGEEAGDEVDIESDESEELGDEEEIEL